MCSTTHKRDERSGVPKTSNCLSRTHIGEMKHPLFEIEESNVSPPPWLESWLRDQGSSALFCSRLTEVMKEGTTIHLHCGAGGVLFLHQTGGMTRTLSVSTILVLFHRPSSGTKQSVSIDHRLSVPLLHLRDETADVERRLPGCLATP